MSDSVTETRADPVSGLANDRKDCTLGQPNCQACVSRGDFSAHFLDGNWRLFFRHSHLTQIEYVGPITELASVQAASAIVRVAHLLRKEGLREFAKARYLGRVL